MIGWLVGMTDWLVWLVSMIDWLIDWLLHILMTITNETVMLLGVNNYLRLEIEVKKQVCMTICKVPSGPWKSLKVLEFKRCKFKALKVLENGGPWKWLVAFGQFLLIESLIELLAMLLWILVAMLLWKDCLLRNTLDGIFCYSVAM